MRVLQSGRLTENEFLSGDSDESSIQAFNELCNHNILVPVTRQFGQTVSDLILQDEDESREREDPSTLLKQRMTRAKKKGDMDDINGSSKSLSVQLGRVSIKDTTC